MIAYFQFQSKKIGRTFIPLSRSFLRTPSSFAKHILDERLPFYANKYLEKWKAFLLLPQIKGGEAR